MTVMSAAVPAASGTWDLRSRPIRWVAFALLVGLAAASVAMFLVWRSDAHALSGHGNTSGLRFRAGQTLMSATAITSTRPVTVDSVTPNVRLDSAGATIAMRMCVHPTGMPFIGVVWPRQLSRACGAVVPINGQTVHFGAVGAAEVIAIIRARRPGRLVVAGWRVAYSAGWRHGSQLSGTDINAVIQPAR